MSSEFCSQADFVIKTDDDIYIDLYATHTVLQKLMKNKKNQKVHAYLMKIRLNNDVFILDRTTWRVG